MGNDSDQDFFSDGISEDILNGLVGMVRARDIKIIARSSSFQFKGQNKDVRRAGELLDATHLVEGSVRIADQRIRVTARLVSASDGVHIWSDQYDRELADVFAVQDAIVHEILEALDVYFATRRVVSIPTSDPHAYRAYLAARDHHVHDHPDLALKAIRNAIALDPQYADAHAWLAQLLAYKVRRWQATLTETLPEMTACIERALALDPDSLPAQRQRIVNRFFANRDYQQAIAEMHGLLSVTPDDPGTLSDYAIMMQTVGRHDLAVAITRRAIDRDPLNPMLQVAFADRLTQAELFEEALAALRLADELGASSHWSAFFIYLKRGDRDGMRAQIERDGWPDELLRVLAAAALAHSDGDGEALAREIGRMPATPEFDEWESRMGYRLQVTYLENNYDVHYDLWEQHIAESPYHLADLLAPRYPPLEHPRRKRLLETYALDGESVASLQIPALPFPHPQVP